MRYRHRITVQNTKTVRGSANQSEQVPEGDPVQVRGNRHPLDADEIVLWGDSSRETAKWFCRTWPGNIHSQLTLDGAQWDQVAPAKVFDIGSTTKHVEVIIRKR